MPIWYNEVTSISLEEVELWTRAGHIKIELKCGINIRKFERLLAEYIL